MQWHIHTYTHTHIVYLSLYSETKTKHWKRMQNKFAFAFFFAVVFIVVSRFVWRRVVFKISEISARQVPAHLPHDVPNLCWVTPTAAYPQSIVHLQAGDGWQVQIVAKISASCLADSSARSLDVPRSCCCCRRRVGFFLFALNASSLVSTCAKRWASNIYHPNSPK